jgi:acetylornithine deacetylase/succinyl-diaminopimelate desuccinylase-like protein
LLDPATADAAQATLATRSLLFDSMVRTSISPNQINGGFRFNVIPAEAEATLDIRALPDEDIEAFANTLRALIDDPAVEVTMRSGGGSRPAAPPSGLDTDMFRALERVQQSMYPDAITLPSMLTAATDMAQLRAKGVAAYGIGAPEAEGVVTAHGNDERVSVAGLGQFVEFMYRTVSEVAVSR